MENSVTSDWVTSSTMRGTWPCGSWDTASIPRCGWRETQGKPAVRDAPSLGANGRLTASHQDANACGAESAPIRLLWCEARHLRTRHAAADPAESTPIGQSWTKPDHSTPRSLSP